MPVDLRGASLYTRIRFTGIRWSQLISATSISGIQGGKQDILFILRHLQLAGSPIQYLSFHGALMCNIVLPGMRTGRFRAPEGQRICLPHLQSLRVGCDCDLAILANLSLPQLRSFEAVANCTLNSKLESLSTFLARSPLLEILDIQLLFCEAAKVLAEAVNASPNLVEIHVRLMDGRDGIYGQSMDNRGEICAQQLLDALAQRARSGCVDLEMMAVWFEWTDASAFRPPAPWVLSANDCGCVARFHVNNVL